MVSVVVPVYNVEKYLRECVESVLGQTYGDFELILVDDGSTDSSGEMCDQYALKDGRITVIHRENGGLSAARNTGMDASRGEYIYFLDSDDYIRGDALERLVARAEETGADITYFDTVIFYDGVKRDPFMDFRRVKDYGSASGPDAAIELQNNIDFLSCVPMEFFKREFLTRHGLRFYLGILHEDELFTATAFVKADRVAHLHEMLFFRRVRTSSIMTTKCSEKNFHGYYVCIRELTKQYSEYDKNSKERRFLKHYLSFLSQAIMLKYYFSLDDDGREKSREDFEDLNQLFVSADCFGNPYLKFNLKHRYLVGKFPIIYMIAAFPMRVFRRLKRLLKIILNKMGLSVISAV